MARQKTGIPVPNKFSGSSNPLLLRALDLPPDAPYKVKEPNSENQALVWPLKYKYEPVGCPADCHKECPKRDVFERHGQREVDYVGLPSGSTPRIFRVRIRRWLSACGEFVPPSPLPGMSGKHQLTVPALEYEVQEIKVGTPAKFLARTVGNGLSTVYRIKDEYFPKMPLHLRIDPTMESFGVDEVEIGDVFYTIFVDNTNRRYIGMVRGTDEDSIAPAFLEIRAKCNIKRATADFSRGYIPLLRRYFASITVTGDKYHLIEKIKEFIDIVRRDQANRLTEAQANEIRDFLGYNEEEEPSDEDEDAIEEEAEHRSAASTLKADADLFKNIYAKFDKAKQERLKRWLEIVPEIKPHWVFLQRLYSLLSDPRIDSSMGYKRFCKVAYQFVDTQPVKEKEKDKNRNRNKDNVEGKNTSPKKFQYPGLTNFMRRQFDEIVAYFWTREDNSRAESMNSRIGQMIIDAHGLAPEEINRLMLERYGFNEVESREPATDADNDSADKGGNKKSRHGRHSRKKWPFKLPAKDDRPMQLPLDLGN